MQEQQSMSYVEQNEWTEKTEKHWLPFIINTIQYNSNTLVPHWELIMQLRQKKCTHEEQLVENESSIYKIIKRQLCFSRAHLKSIHNHS